jgi:hypothetical protein
MRRIGAVLVRAVRNVHPRLVIHRSGVFDSAYYREQSRARGLRVLDPVGHYLRRGAVQGLDPHPWFQTRYYLLRNPDVEGRMNPLAHFLLHGDAEGRRPHPRFDPDWYRAAHPDVARAGWNTLSHFVKHGIREGRSSHPRFDAQYGVPAQPAQGGVWAHYLEQGRARGASNRREALRLHLEAADAAVPERNQPSLDAARDARMLRGLRLSGLFDPDHYRDCWGADFEALGDAARHFLERGAVEGVGFCPAERLEKTLRSLESALEGGDRPELAYLRSACAPPSLDAGHQVSIYVSSRGNAFFHEMAELLAHGFRRAGAETRILDETAEPAAESSPGHGHSIVVAPHEFFLLGDGP